MNSSNKHFTSLLDNYHLHVKVLPQFSELHLEVLDLKTLKFCSCIIKEQSLDPQGFENLDQLYEVFCEGLQNPSEKIRVTVTDHKKVCLIISQGPPQYKVFEYNLQETMTTSSLPLENEEEDVLNSDKMSSAWGRLSKLIFQTRDMNKKLKKIEEQLERQNYEKEIADLRVEKLEKGQEISIQEIKMLKGKLKKYEKLEEQFNGNIENAFKNDQLFKYEITLDKIPLVNSVEMIVNNPSIDNNKVIEAMKDCYEKFREELVNFSKYTQEIILRHKEESFKQYQQLLEQRLADKDDEIGSKFQEHYDNSENNKKSLEEKISQLLEEIEKKRVDESETRLLKIKEEFESKLSATESKIALNEEAMNGIQQNFYQNFDSLLRKLEILEKRHIPSKTHLQGFQAFEVVFDKDLGYLSPNQKTIECQNVVGFDEKSFFSGNALPDSGKYSISFKYDQGEFKENASLIFGVFPLVNRQKPLISSYKYMLDVLNDQALVEENQFQIDKAQQQLNPGTIVTIYVDIDQKDISFVVGDKVRMSYPLSNWLRQKMYCGVFMRNPKKFKISIV